MSDTLLMLSQSLDRQDDDLAHRVEDLEATLRSSVATYLGLTLVLPGPTGPAEITTMPYSHTPSGPVGSSLLVPIQLVLAGTTPGAVAGPARAAEPTTRSQVAVILYAVRAGAFVDLSADLAWLSRTDLGEVRLDQHLTPVTRRRNVSGSLSRQTDIDQAVGVLIGKGRTPEQALDTLSALASLAGTDLECAAHSLLDELTGHEVGTLVPAARARPDVESKVLGRQPARERRSCTD